MAQHWGDPGVEATWGSVKRWAEANQVPDAALVITDSGRTVNDLDQYEAQDGEPPEFVLLTQARRQS